MNKRLEFQFLIIRNDPQKDLRFYNIHRVKSDSNRLDSMWKHTFIRLYIYTFVALAIM